METCQITDANLEEVVIPIKLLLSNKYIGGAYRLFYMQVKHASTVLSLEVW